MLAGLSNTYSTALHIRHKTVMFVLRLQRLRAHLVLGAANNIEDVQAVGLRTQSGDI